VSPLHVVQAVRVHHLPLAQSPPNSGTNTKEVDDPWPHRKVVRPRFPIGSVKWIIPLQSLNERNRLITTVKITE
jgi:hypothetical protein